MQMKNEPKHIRQMRLSDIAKYERNLQFDPHNASFHALLAEQYHAVGRGTEAIHEWRTAINLSPDGPQTARWKSSLRHALEVQAGHNSYDFAVCPDCQCDIPTGARVCPRCNAAVQMSFFEWLRQPANLKSIARQTAPFTLVGFLVWLTVASLSNEWKACVACGAVIVGGCLFLRRIGQ